MSDKQEPNNFLKRVKSTSKKMTKAVTETAEGTRNTIVSASEKLSEAIEEKKVASERNRQEQYEAALLPLKGTVAEGFITALGESPMKLTGLRVTRIKDTFPIPREQNILWADAEFDLRPSGIAVTEKGVFIRTNVAMIDQKPGISNFVLSEMDAEEQEAYIQHNNQFHSGKAALLYYSWSDFDPGYFIGKSEYENKALLVEPQCANRFIETCVAYSKQGIDDPLKTVTPIVSQDDIDKRFMQSGVLAGAALESAEIAVFAEQKAHINTPAGHGEMAEEAINMLDRLRGLDAKVIGRDNTKDGADRVIGDIFIQTKYYNSARGSLEACFNPETGQYRYMNDGQPMQLEVPKDQYRQVVDGFKQKIKNGKIPGVTDPNEAVNLVREGKITYQQAVNLTKPGTIESLSYDALTGVVTCTCALGITFVTTVFLTWRKTGDIMQAIHTGASAGLQVFGISFLQHMVVSQVARTGLASSLLVPSQYLVGKLGYQTSATLVNGIRTLSGKSAIYGAAASKHLAKILRSNAVTSVLSFAVFSIPETYNVASRKISGAQYAKNMSVLAGSIAVGAGGAIAAGIATAKVAAVAGTAVTPGVGTVVGLAGGFAAGAVGAKAAQVAGDLLHEDDVTKNGRLFNAFVSCLIGEYLLDEAEIDKLVSYLNEIEQREFKLLFENIEKSREQELVLREFLYPYYDSITLNRTEFLLPSAEYMVEALAELAG